MPSSARPTLRDVARRASISMMSVSRVLNNKGYASQELRAKVERAIRELNYVPNQAAKVLATNQLSRNVAILFDAPSTAVLEEMIAAGYPEAGLSQVQLAFIKVRGFDDPARACATITELGIRGAILSPPLCDDLRLRACLSKAGIRSVAIACGDPNSPISTIGIDDWRAAHALTLHLVEHGHRRIGFVAGHPRQRSSVRRRAGYEAALLEHGLEPEPVSPWEDCDSGQAASFAASQALGSRSRPSAIVAADEAAAAAVVGAAGDRAIVIPQALSLCAFSDIGGPAVSPPLTTVTQPMGLMASWGIRQLAEELGAVERGQRPEIRRVLFDHDIIHGESVAPPKQAEAGDLVAAAWGGMRK